MIKYICLQLTNVSSVFSIDSFYGTWHAIAASGNQKFGDISICLFHPFYSLKSQLWHAENKE